ncbi:hypothetical protein CC1G_10126 [Coprinopsis cinerea okayama7|uniref:Uncharacterized protein n=1 Tax=Coprinopsis cinerea (strain Okayama-7 / 130 / ATCC MYA-4618 / FGSC 9003) TaxID=240176 RepID=A8N3Y7_COPC7|nr:hypothetical protein CC1G_10126 [Coprinopsis cinerea okayama7\|eukprot:XP_001829596.2 hypothetical protein CC1G_10126 [Coprinopsis cinerea okayama7\
MSAPTTESSRNVLGEEGATVSHDGGGTKEGIDAEPPERQRSHSPMSYHMSSDEEEDSVSSVSEFGLSGSIDDATVSSAYIKKHTRSLQWMYVELQERQNSYYRLQNLLRRDLALIEAAICNKEHELEEGRE